MNLIEYYKYFRKEKVRIYFVYSSHEIGSTCWFKMSTFTFILALHITTPFVVMLLVSNNNTNETNKLWLVTNQHKDNYHSEHEKKYSTNNSALTGRKKRGAIASSEKLWNGGIIPFEIAFNYSGGFLKMIHESMQMWMNGTCVAFVEKQTFHHSWLRIQPGPCGCCSQVGRQSVGMQYLYLGRECDKVGIIAHELGHAMGFWHEHTRPDRDEYIYVLEENVDYDQRYNFLKKSYDEVDSLGEPYDPHSIMHYAANTFSKSELSFTILLKENQHHSYTDEDFFNAMGQLGQRIRPSTGDISQTNKLYRCPPCGGNIFLYEINQWIEVEPRDPISHCQYCGWRLIASPGSKITVRIDEVELVYGQFAVIYDGFQRGSVIIAYIDGFKRLLKNDLLSSHEYLFVGLWSSNTMEANTDDSVFRISVKATCGGNLTAKSGYLSNPGYPAKFSESNTVCDWVITAREDQSIYVNFYYYSFEGANESAHVAVYEGNRNEDVSPLVFFLQNVHLDEDTKTLQSTTNSLRILMHSGGSGGVSFYARYYAQDNPCKPSTYGCEQLCSNLNGKPSCSCDIGYWLAKNKRSCETYKSIMDLLDDIDYAEDQAKCTQVINITKKRRFGKIASPIDPETSKYPGNLNCFWLIKASKAFRLKIKFIYFEVEGSQGFCAYDRLEMHQLDSSLKQKGNTTVYCGNKIPRTFFTTTSIINITFRSDVSIGGRGFELHYFAKLKKTAKNGKFL